MSSIYELNKIAQYYAYFFLLWLALLQLHVLAESFDKGLKLLQLPLINNTYGLEAAPKNLPSDVLKPMSKIKKTPVPVTAGQYEIRAVSGEPNYKSVNLTWEVEFVSSPFTTPLSITSNDTTVKNNSSELEPPTSFQIFYCEMQSFGPQRCRSKSVNSSSQQIPDKQESKYMRKYTVQIGNLRMATKYSFHLRPEQNRKSSLRITGRSEIFNNEVNDETNELNSGGQTIFVPTKGFSAQATKCLPHASEIEVETGPYFGGKIVVDDSNCGIKGNPDDSVEKYTMRIDHKLCGSLVKPETNTVETFITVQENLGIFTHSTRRFVVVCSFQSGMQTVRASFTVPGKEGVAAAVENDPFEPDERIGREHRQMRYVNKSALITKKQSIFEQTSLEESIAAIVQNPALAIVESNQRDEDATDTVAILEHIIPGVNEQHIKHENELRMEEATKPVAHARLAKLFAEQNEPKHYFEDESFMQKLNNKRNVNNKSKLHPFAANVGSMILTISLSVIMIGVFVYVVLRETRRQAFMNANSMRRQQQPHQQRAV